MVLGKVGSHLAKNEVGSILPIIWRQSPVGWKIKCKHETINPLKEINKGKILKSITSEQKDISKNNNNKMIENRTKKPKD